MREYTHHAIDETIGRQTNNQKAGFVPVLLNEKQTTSYVLI